MRIIVIAAALLLPAAAHAQSSQSGYYGRSVAITPPSYGADSSVESYASPFPSPLARQQRLLEMLNTGGVEQPAHRTVPQGCIYSGQVYSEGAIVRNGAGRQRCDPHAGAEPDASGQLPLSWRAVPGD